MVTKRCFPSSQALRDLYHRINKEEAKSKKSFLVALKESSRTGPHLLGSDDHTTFPTRTNTTLKVDNNTTNITTRTTMLRMVAPTAGTATNESCSGGPSSSAMVTFSRLQLLPLPSSNQSLTMTTTDLNSGGMTQGEMYNNSPASSSLISLFSATPQTSL